MVIVKVLFPHRGKVWRGATVPAMVALYARCCFTSCPMRRGFCYGLRHCLLFSWGRRIGVGSRPQVVDHLVSLVELVATILGSRVVAPIDLDGL